MSCVRTSQLAGFGHHAPAQRIVNAQMEQWFNLETGWIERRTGIRARRWVNEGETLVDLAEKASVDAINNAGISRREIAMTILATSTPDHLLPPTAPLLTHRLGLSHAGSFDLSGACTGFLYALVMADGFVRAQAKPVLVVAANILSRRINLAEHSSAILFGDAAGAVVMLPATDATKGILASNFVSDGSGYDLISIAAGGSQRPFSPAIPPNEFKMNLRDGQAIFSQAIKIMTQCAVQAMADAQLGPAHIHRFIPHQANLRISENTAKQLGIPAAKTHSTLGEYGNSSAAGIPLTLSLSHRLSPFVTGEKILLTAAGAGVTGGAIVIGF